MIRALALSLVITTSASAGVIARWQGDSAKAQAGMRVSLSPTGPWVALPLARAKELDVFDVSNTRPRFLDYAGGVSLLLYAETDKLETVMIATTPLRPTIDQIGTAFDDQTVGMVLRAGEIVDAEPDDSGHRKVSWRLTWSSSESLEVRGFVPSASVGKVYRIDATPHIPTFQSDITLPGNYQLLDTPKGTAFVVSKNRVRAEAMKLSTQNGFTLVRVARAVGWIATAQTKKIPNAARDPEQVSQAGSGRVAAAAADPQSTLPRGTVLYDAIDGTPIGEVADLFTNKAVATQPGWAQFTIASHFGPISVWAKK
jgi:hypothetical protein